MFAVGAISRSMLIFGGVSSVGGHLINFLKRHMASVLAFDIDQGGFAGAEKKAKEFRPRHEDERAELEGGADHAGHKVTSSEAANQLEEESLLILAWAR